MFLSIASFLIFIATTVMIVVAMIVVFTERAQINGVRLLVTVVLWVASGYFLFDYPTVG